MIILREIIDLSHSTRNIACDLASALSALCLRTLAATLPRLGSSVPAIHEIYRPARRHAVHNGTWWRRRSAVSRPSVRCGLSNASSSLEDARERRIETSGVARSRTSRGEISSHFCGNQGTSLWRQLTLLAWYGLWLEILAFEEISCSQRRSRNCSINLTAWSIFRYFDGENFISGHFYL